MSDEIRSVPDMIADVTAQCDQVQIEINTARLVDIHDQQYQLELDRRQQELDAKRKRLELFAFISDIVYPK